MALYEARRGGWRRLVRFVAALALAVPATSVGARIVAVGDVHGELEGLLGILRRSGIVDEDHDWSGGEAILVQTGDLFDRGPDVRAAVELLMKLEEQAAAAGGRVEALLGNHEQMNLVLEFRDASPEAIRKFAGDDAEELRRQALDAWERWRAAWARDRGREAPTLDDVDRRRWLEEHPPGFAEYVDALVGDGPVARWVQRRPVTAVIDDVLFSHAGISPAWVGVPLQEIERRHREAFEAFRTARRRLLEEELIHPLATVGEIRSTLRAYLEEPPLPEHRRRAADEAVAEAVAAVDGLVWMFADDSPLWFRGYANMSEEELASHLDSLEESLGAERFVAAHSPIASARIVDRLDGRLFLIDTGMLEEVYDGRASALQIGGGRIAALYPDDQEILVEWTQPRRRWLGPGGEELPFAGHEDALAYLASARVVSTEPIPRGVTHPVKVLLEGSGVPAHGVFRDVDRRERFKRLRDGSVELQFVDSYRSDLAAYELSRLLGLDNVPPEVPRWVRGDAGALQLWIEGATLYHPWMEDHPGERAPDLYLERQLMDMRVFDVLIRNIDRNAGNFLWDADHNLWLIDHTRSFSPARDLRGTDRIRGCSRSLWRALSETDEEEIRERMSPRLSKPQLKALLARWNELVKLLAEKIEMLGTERFLFEYRDPPPGVKMRDDQP